MRDPNRIDEFCAHLAELWHNVQDWRFGQLMCNVLGQIASDRGIDPFYIEDGEMLKYMKNYFKENEDE